MFTPVSSVFRDIRVIYKYSQESITGSVYLVLGWWVNRFAWINLIPRDWFLFAPRSRSTWLIKSPACSRRAECRNGKFKKIMKTRNILIFLRYFIDSIHSFLLMKICTFQKKSTAGEYTKEGENICPPSKIILNNYPSKWRWIVKYILQHIFSTAGEYTKEGENICPSK